MKTLRIVLAALTISIMGLSQSAKAQDDEDKSFFDFMHFKKLPSKLTFMAGPTSSYDEDFNGIDGSGLVLIGHKPLFKEHAYTSLTLFGPHRYHYTSDTIDVMIRMLSADVAAGIAMPNSVSGLIGGTSFGVFAGYGVRNDSKELPLRYGLELNINVNFFTFTDGWKNENMFGMFIRSTYSAVSFTYNGEKKTAMNEEVAWGLKFSVLKYGK